MAHETMIRARPPMEFVVDQEGGGSFTSIQEAFIYEDTLIPGDTLKVWWGSGYIPYAGRVNVTEAVTIRSDVMHNGLAKPIIDGDGGGAVFNVTASNVRIFNFTVQNGKLGINLHSTATNTAIEENLIRANIDYGIYVASENNTIRKNAITNNKFGLQIVSNGNLLRNNNMTSNDCNFGISKFVNNDIDTSTVDGKPICVWVNKHLSQVPLNAGYVAVVNSTNILVEGNEISKNDYGVQFINVSDSTIFNVTVHDNLNDGIRLLNTTNVRIENVNASLNNPASGGSCGICVKRSPDFMLIENIASYNGFAGVSVESSDDGQIIGNVMSSNFGGLNLYDSNNNMIVENAMQNNTCFGIWDVSCAGNTFCHNNIKGSTNQAYVEGSSENWHNGAEGNYWSYYTGVDLNKDGIGDTPHILDDPVVDRYPLMKPWKQTRIFNVAKTGAFKGYNITMHSNHVIDALNFTKIVETETYPRQLRFNITAGSAGFCNITIRREWLDGPFSIYVNNIPWTFQLTQTANYSSLYFTYTTGVFQVKIIAIRPGTLQGDINLDGKIDMKDISSVAKLFGRELTNLTPDDVTDYDP